MQRSVLETPDGYRSGYRYRAEDGREGLDAGSEVRRVLRGGSWNDVQVSARAADRVGGHSVDRNGEGGFRLARSVPSPISG